MTKSPLRVLLVADHTDHDGALHGAGRQLLEITSCLADRPDVKASAVVLGTPSSLGLKLVEDYPLEYLGASAYNPCIALRLFQKCRRERLDILHVTDFAASSWGRIAGKAAGVPVIVHVRSHHSPQQPRGFPPHVAAAYRLLAPFTARTIAISESVREFAEHRMGFEQAQVEVMNNPLARSSFRAAEPGARAAIRKRHGIPPDAALTGAVTRFHSVKGIHHLVRAVPLVREQVPDAHLLLVGQGPEEGRLKTLAAEIGVLEQVIFAGYREDVQSYYQSFDVSVVPSLEEGFGNVALEAMACGTPVVASDLGGLREIVSDGRNGLLVPAAQPVALAAAVVKILSDPELAKRLSEAGQDRAREFSLEAYVDRLVDLYHRVAN